MFITEAHPVVVCYLMYIKKTEAQTVASFAFVSLKYFMHIWGPVKAILVHVDKGADCEGWL